MNKNILATGAELHGLRFDLRRLGTALALTLLAGCGAAYAGTPGQEANASDAITHTPARGPATETSPCITTAFVPLVSQAGQALRCAAAAVDDVEHRIHLELVDSHNVVHDSADAALSPGQSATAGIDTDQLVGLWDVYGFRCIVTSDEGTTAALRGVRVMASAFGVSSAPQPRFWGASEGQVVARCAMPSAPSR